MIIGQDLRIDFLQYYFKNGPEKSVVVPPHGNGSKKAPHGRLQDSTSRRIDPLAAKLSSDKSTDGYSRLAASRTLLHVFSQPRRC